MQIEDTAVASFTDGADDIPVKSLTVDITPVQSGSGDPSPENVRPISGWTGANVTRTGKNTAGSFRTGYVIDGTTGAITSGTNANWISQRIKVGGNQFTVKVLDKGNMTTGSINLARYRADGSLYDYTNLGYFSSTMPITVTYNVASVDSIILYGYQSDGATAIDTAKIQVEFGSTATDYEPYKGNVYPITFPTSAGTVYGGTLDVTSGVLTVDRKVETLNGASAESWSFNQIGSSSIYRTGHVLSDAIQANDVAISANKYKGVTFNARDNTTANIAWIYGAEHMLSINTTETTLDAFKASLASTPLQVCYQITPITYQLDETAVNTILGQNNIFADTGNVNELTYRADLKAYIDSHVGS